MQPFPAFPPTLLSFNSESHFSNLLILEALGPFLFPIYPYILSALIQSYGFKFHVHTDDTQIYSSSSGQSPESRLTYLTGFLTDIYINISKTELLIFSPKPHSVLSFQLC